MFDVTHLGATSGTSLVAGAFLTPISQPTSGAATAQPCLSGSPSGLMGVLNSMSGS
jgi:hypothetical protein